MKLYDLLPVRFNDILINDYCIKTHVMMSTLCNVVSEYRSKVKVGCNQSSSRRKPYNNDNFSWHKNQFIIMEQIVGFTK